MRLGRPVVLLPAYAHEQEGSITAVPTTTAPMEADLKNVRRAMTCARWNMLVHVTQRLMVPHLLSPWESLRALRTASSGANS